MAIPAAIHSRAARIVVTGASFLLVGAAASVVPAGADTSARFDTFSAAATADPISVEVVDPGAPVVPGGQLVYGTPTITRVALDSIGNSTGFAAGPYPGDTAPGVMAAFNAVSPTGPVFPGYPFSVSSRYPGDPEKLQANGPQRLAATSQENRSTAEAHVGLAEGDPSVASVLSTSTAEQDGNSGAVTAKAASVINGFSVGSTLKIVHVSSRAQITARPGQGRTKETSFTLGAITVGDTTVGLTDKGELVPAPGAPPRVDISALSKQLAAAGITLTYLPASETETTVNSAGLAVGLAHEIPGQGLVRLTVTLGRVGVQVGYTEAGIDQPSLVETGIGSGTEHDGSVADGSGASKADGAADPATEHVQGTTASVSNGESGAFNPTLSEPPQFYSSVGAAVTGSPSSAVPKDVFSSSPEAAPGASLNLSDPGTAALSAPNATGGTLRTQPILQRKDLGSKIYLAMAGATIAVLAVTALISGRRSAVTNGSVLRLPRGS
jgi:hypothetical protein